MHWDHPVQENMNRYPFILLRDMRRIKENVAIKGDIIYNLEKYVDFQRRGDLVDEDMEDEYE